MFEADPESTILKDKLNLTLFGISKRKASGERKAKMETFRMGLQQCSNESGLYARTESQGST